MMQQLCMNKFVSPTTGATISSFISAVWHPSALCLCQVLHFGDGRCLHSEQRWQAPGFLSGLFRGYRSRMRLWFRWWELCLTMWFPEWPAIWHIIWNDTGIIFLAGGTFFHGFKRKELLIWNHFIWSDVLLVILAFLFANHFNIVEWDVIFRKIWNCAYLIHFCFGNTFQLQLWSQLYCSGVVCPFPISGLIVAPMISMIKDRIRGTLMDTALFGAVFVPACDMIGRKRDCPYELPIELIVGIVAGSILFICHYILQAEVRKNPLYSSFLR